MPTSLSPRQLECAKLFARGLQAKEIGRRLNIQTRTVETHIEEAYRRLGVSGRPALQRALGIEYGGEPSPIPETGTALPDRPVDEAHGASEAETGAGFLYDRYARLGQVRTPPRWPLGRLVLIMLIAVALAVALGGIVAIMSTVFGVLDVANDA